MATIFDVAQAAGVSTGTVSRALNDHPDVSASARERVLRAATALGYRPDPLARGLITRATSLIGLVVPDVALPFFHELARGVEDVASAGGYLVVLCNTDRRMEHEQRYLAALSAHRAAGLILAGAPPEEPPADELPADGPPAVLVIRRRPAGGPPWPAVLLDYREGVRQAVSHLITLGHRRVGCVNGPAAHANSADRLAGYRDALAASGLPFDPDLVTAADFTIEGGYQATVRLLAGLNPPAALFLANDYMAIGAIQAARARGLRVPEDLSIVGYDDFVVAALFDPPLTTVRVPMREMGEQAMRLLLAEISRRRRAPRGGMLVSQPREGAVSGGADMQGPTEQPQEVAEVSPTPPETIVATELVIRQSTAPPPVRAGEVTSSRALPAPGG